MIKWLFGLIALSAAVLAIYLFFHLGAYKDVTIRQTNNEGLHLLYQLHYGPYHKVNALIHEVELWATKQGFRCSITFGEYLDDPAAVDPPRLRSNLGCVLPSAPTEPLPEPYQYRYVAPGPVVEAEFLGSPSIGPFTVYPEVNEYLRENRLMTQGPVFEIYIPENGSLRTRYLFPLKTSAQPRED